RQTNVRFVAQKNDRWSASRLDRIHLLTIGLDFVRGMLLVALGLPLLTLVALLLGPLWAISESVATLLLTAMVAGLLAGSLRVVGNRIWFAAAGAGGALVLLAA